MMPDTLGTRPDGADDRDPVVEDWMSRLDPGAHRPAYWASFHRTVVEAARFELARRRRLADLTVAGTVTSWARAVVPSALLTAAAAAAILFVMPAAPTAEGEGDVTVEELLSVGLEGEPFPDELDEEGAMSATFAAAEIF